MDSAVFPLQTKMSVIIHDPLRFPFEAELQLFLCQHRHTSVFVCAYIYMCV